VSTADRPLAGLRFVLVGPGRVGESLASWALACGAHCLQVAGRSASGRTAEVARRLGAAAVATADCAASDADLALLAVPDAALPAVARQLAGRVRGVALHAAGALGAAVLEPLRSPACAVGTFHPLAAFPAPRTGLAAARGIFFALDGDPEARALGRRLAAAFGGEAAVVPEEIRDLYHLAASLAAGGVATVLASALDLARRAGVPEAARAGCGALARGALAAALAAAEPATAITGPAVRGDLETVERQLAALAGTAPDLRPLVIALARAALDRRAQLAPASPAQRALAERLARPDLLDRPRKRVLTSGLPD